MKYLIVGLGNIGVEYESTRHNIGFMIADAFAKELKTDFTTERLAMVATGKYRSRSIILIKPTTYMNLSGRSVKYWLQKSKVPLSNLIIITDDISLPFGKLRLRGKGSSSGHNGLKDIETQIATQSYARLKFGIGQNFHQGHQANYVLSSFKTEERMELPNYINQSCEALKSFVSIGLMHTMNHYNRK